MRDVEARFVSWRLLLFQWQTPAVRARLPALYLHGLVLGDFDLALRELSARKLVYLWADGIYVKAGLEDRKAALLMLIGADAAGPKQVLAVTSGERESTPSGTAVLRDLKTCGLGAPKLTIADGHLGIWGAIATIYPTSGEPRCWNHTRRNVLDAVPKQRQVEVKTQRQAIANADTLHAATMPRDPCTRTYRRIIPKAVACLERDWGRLVASSAFPQEHWQHLRTTNVIESPFAVGRLRPSAAKRFQKVDNATALIWKTLLVVEQHFRKLNAPHLCTAVHAGVVFHDGIRTVTPSRERHAA